LPVARMPVPCQFLKMQQSSNKVTNQVATCMS